MRISDWSSDVCSSDLDWTVHSAALAEREWKDAGEQWNAPTSRTLAPGEAIEVGVRLVQAPSIRAIESTLIANKRPVAIGIPGYVVPMDQQASLFVKAPSRILSVESHPAGAVEAKSTGSVKGWVRMAIRGRKSKRLKSSPYCASRMTSTA